MGYKRLIARFTRLLLLELQKSSAYLGKYYIFGEYHQMHQPSCRMHTHPNTRTHTFVALAAGVGEGSVSDKAQAALLPCAA